MKTYKEEFISLYFASISLRSVHDHNFENFPLSLKDLSLIQIFYRMLFLLPAWALASLFHCIPILKLCKCPFTAQSCSVPTSSTDIHSLWDFSLQEQGNIVCLCFFLKSFLLLFESFQHELQDISVWKYYFFFSLHNGGRLQATSSHAALSYYFAWCPPGGNVACLQNVSLMRDSTSCRLSPSMGLGPLLAIWDFKSSVYWTATHQLKNPLEAALCQKYVRGICRKSIAFFTYHMKNIDLVHTFVPVWKLFPILLRAVFSPEFMLRASFIYSTVPSYYCHKQIRYNKDFQTIGKQSSK